MATQNGPQRATGHEDRALPLDELHGIIREHITRRIDELGAAR